jgi:two-component system cell cycle sensor histidine kinase/response regulator CckA
MSRIAVVEHEGLVALDIARTLERAGHVVGGPFHDTSAFLSALRGGAEFDLALIDLSLQKPVSGLAAALEARSRAGTPCVFISALSGDDDLERTKEAAPLGMLVKPFSERELLNTAELALYRADMESRLSLSEKRYRELFSQSLSPRCIAGLDGRVLEANTSFMRLFSLPGSGGSAGDGTSLSSLFSNKADWEDILLRISDGKIISGEEYSMRDPQGRDLTVLASLSRVRDGSGAPLLSAELFDLTESHRLREELQQSQKMDAMGRLAGGIAHDFNNILTAIIGHAEMLKLDVDESAEAYQDVLGIAKTAGRASQLTRQLLGFSRKQPYAPKVFGLATLVTDASSILRKLAGESILLSVLLPRDDPQVFADPVRIEQALVNLVVNARDAMEGRKDGTIKVLVDTRSFNSERQIGTWILSAGKYAALKVIDNGSGIPKELRQKIFDPFFTTKAMGKGTGLGLSIVTSIAAQSKGAIELESEPGKGSEFTFWMPALEGSAAGVAKAENREENATQVPEDLVLERNPVLLVVDEDEPLLGFLSYVLSKAGGTVLQARNAGEALLLSEKHSPDAMVIDFNLSGMDGLELGARLTAGRKIPCIYTSARLEEMPTLPEGSILLEKPFTPQDLISALGRMRAGTQAPVEREPSMAENRRVSSSTESLEP